MSIPVQTLPPDSRTSYIIDQLEGEHVSIPGSKGVFRILASSKQTNGGIAVFQSVSCRKAVCPITTGSRPR
jgi:hypothetical protein